MDLEDYAVSEKTCLLIDWDDTILPTSAIYESPALRRLLEASRSGSPAILTESPELKQLRQHASRVESVLRRASANGRVAIVTLAKREWICESAALFLPGLKLDQVLDELNIPILYARDHLKGREARRAKTAAGIEHLRQEGVDVYMHMKRNAMAHFLRSVCNGESNIRLNVISVGDSLVEKNAITDLLWDPIRAGLPAANHPLKIVKFQDEPTIADLSEQLRKLALSLPAMVHCREDAEFVGDRIAFYTGPLLCR